jgi:drug/metabolite transporter (DMT)-like permease
MRVVLWTVAALLAAAFAVAGGMKIVRPKQALADQGLAWVESFPPGAIKAIGALEVVAAVALIVPPLVGTASWLAPLAAVGLIALMVGAAITHQRRHEPQLMGVNAVIVILAAVVVWGRFGPYPY